MKKYISVKEFLENQSAESVLVLEELRQILKDNFQGIEEKIWYGVPYYWVNGKEFAGLSVASKHVSFGFGIRQLNETERADFKSIGYKTGTRTVQIPFEKEVPNELILKILNSMI